MTAPTKAAHTPTPLHVGTNANDVIGADGYRYASAYGEHMDERAAHIVRCVNEREELLRALDVANRFMRDNCDNDNEPAYLLVSSILAKVSP